VPEHSASSLQGPRNTTKPSRNGPAAVVSLGAYNVTTRSESADWRGGKVLCSFYIRVSNLGNICDWPTARIGDQQYWFRKHMQVMLAVDSLSFLRDYASESFEALAELGRVYAPIKYLTRFQLSMYVHVRQIVTGKRSGVLSHAIDQSIKICKAYDKGCI
jgi:hypothetical protein